MHVLVTIPACSHERPERHAHRGLRDDGVPMLHVEPIRARLRQLRVLVQELEQDSDEVVTPRPETQHCGHEQKKKTQIWAKGTTERACLLVKRKTDVCTFKKKKCPAKDLFHYRFILIRKIKNRIKLDSLQICSNTKTMKSAPRISVIIFAGMVVHGHAMVEHFTVIHLCPVVGATIHVGS